MPLKRYYESSKREKGVMKRNKGSKLTGEKGTTYKYKKRLSDKFLGSDERRMNKIYAAGAAASRDAHKVGKESGKRFRGTTFKALEGSLKGITFKDTPSNRFNYERPGFFSKKKRSIYKAPDVRFKKTKYLTGGQSKIDANKDGKISGEDFAILRDKKKVVKKAALGAAMMGIAGMKMLKKKNKMAMPGIGATAIIDQKKKELLGRSKGGGADMGKEPTSRQKSRKKFIDALKGLAKTPTMIPLSMSIKKIAKSSKKMGGGMMQRPMGYKSGKSIKVKCKLGKNKPTKMY